MIELINKVFEAIKEDEKEYCFDVCYCSNEVWKKQNGEKTREEEYKRVISHWEELSKNENEFINKVKEFFGDKYDWTINKNVIDNTF